MKYKYISLNESDTISLAQNIEAEKFDKMVICLNGDLGSGKTVFTKAFGQSLEVQEDITSPTFNIIKEYTSGEMPLYYFDVYRLDGKIDSIGIEDYYKKHGIVIIEWADTIADYLPSKRLDIEFRTSDQDEDKRVIILTPHGDKYEELCQNVI